MAIIRGLGLFVYILLGFRYGFGVDNWGLIGFIGFRVGRSI